MYASDGVAEVRRDALRALCMWFFRPLKTTTSSSLSERQEIAILFVEACAVWGGLFVDVGLVSAARTGDRSTKCDVVRLVYCVLM